MKKCPVCGCKKFYTTAHVTQGWLVDTYGDYLKTTEECIEVTHEPKDEDMWQCIDCGYYADGKKFEVKEEN